MFWVSIGEDSFILAVFIFSLVQPKKAMYKVQARQKLRHAK